MPDKTARQGIDAVEVTGAILQALLRCPRPARLKDLEIATGIPSAKIHRYLVSMIRCGLVRRHESHGRYDFGLLAHQVGQVMARDNDLIAQIEARLAQFSQEVGEVIGVAQWVGNGLVFVNWFESSPEFSIRLKPGRRTGGAPDAKRCADRARLPRLCRDPGARNRELTGGTAQRPQCAVGAGVRSRRARRGRRDRARNGTALRRRHGGPAGATDAVVERGTLGPNGMGGDRAASTESRETAQLSVTREEL